MIGRLLAHAALAATLLAPGGASGELTLDRIFTPDPPWGAQPASVVWSPDGTSFVYVLPSQDTERAVALHQFDARTLRDRILIDPADFGERAQTPRDVSWAPDGRSIAFVERGTAYVRDLATGIDRRIASAAADPQWSPAGDKLAFVRDGNLYVASLRGRLRVARLTFDGRSGEILNGVPDWTYAEELGTRHAYQWSPDGTHLLYMRFDERAVNAYVIPDTGLQERYPLPGGSNPKVQLRTIDAAGRGGRIVYDAADRDEYLPAFAWDQTAVLFEVVDRAQKHLRVVSASSGRISEIYSQSDARWVEPVPLPLRTSGGASLWLLDRDGTFAVYRRGENGAFARLTGAYRVFGLLGYDERSGRAYAAAAYPSRRDRAVIAISQDGTVTSVLGGADGHEAVLSPDRRLAVDTASAPGRPPQTSLVQLDGGVSLAVLAPRSDAVGSALFPVENLEVPSEYGALDAWMIRPQPFDPSRRYPVVVYAYGGPDYPTTAKAFEGARALYHQLLAHRGYIVFSIDGPASQIDDDAHARTLYKNVGAGSLAGQEAGVRYLRSLPYVDPSRVGIWGWSFGGYETVYALTHSTSFKTGAAVAPVADWRAYDSIYAERYLGSPSADAAAYDGSSLLTGNDLLHGDLLLQHGIADGNVHVVNSRLLSEKYAHHGREVELKLYPGASHAIRQLAARRQVYEQMLDWWQTHL